MRVTDFSQAVTVWDLSGRRARRHSLTNADLAKLRAGFALATVLFGGERRNPVHPHDVRSNERISTFEGA